MMRAIKHWAIPLLITAGSCAPVKPVKVSPVRYSAFQPAAVADYHREFAQYCQTDLNKDYETSAVVSNFFGEHRRSIEFATLRDSRLLRPDYEVQIPGNQERVFRDHIEGILNNPQANAEEKRTAARMLMLVTTVDYAKTFTTNTMADAIETVVDKAGEFRFLLINEAHNSARNRAFTTSLLRPLWEKGYRYLALEALSHQDKDLVSRGYPTVSTGHYFGDPVFGNMLREALSLGYKLIPYESKNPSQNPTLRDRDQALNIYNSTLKTDPEARVIVHAGYSHISEEGGPTYTPMGAQLKALVKQEILTVDQVTMTERNDSLKMHPYYRHVMTHLKPQVPVVFKNEQDILVDPIRLASIDIQVYHPATVYRKGRPNWLLQNGAKLYELPAEFVKHRGFLLQAFRDGEPDSAVPVDQFVIEEENALLLKPGKYVLKLTDRSGTLSGTAALQIDRE